MGLVDFGVFLGGSGWSDSVYVEDLVFEPKDGIIDT